MRYLALDGLRGIAALAVAIFHLNLLHSAYSFPLVRNAYLFVDFFFVLSGFIIAYAYSKKLADRSMVATFVVRRVGRLWPLHLSILVAFIGLEFLRWGYAVAQGQGAKVQLFDAVGPVPIADLPAHLTLTNGLGFLSALNWNLPSWSISAEFWTYMVYACAVYIFPRYQARTLLGLSIASMVALVALAPKGIGVTYDFGFLRCICGFTLGALVHEATSRTAAPDLKLLATAEIPVCFVACMFVVIADKSALSFAAPLVFATMVYVFSFEAGVMSRGLKHTWLQILGRLSYSIYMVHALVLSVIDLAAIVLQQSVFGRDIRLTLPNGSKVIGNVPPIALDLALVGYLAIVVGLSWLMYRFIEDPCRWWFHGKSLTLAKRIAGDAAVPARTATAGA